MKSRIFHKYVLLSGFYCLPFLLAAQNNTLKLSTGDQQLAFNNSASTFKDIKEKAVYNGRYYYIARFAELPATAEQNLWEKEGFRFHSSLSAKTYLVSSSAEPSPEFAKKHYIVQTAVVDPALKVSRNLAYGKASRLATEAGGRVAVLVSVLKGVAASAIRASLSASGMLELPAEPTMPPQIRTLLVLPEQISQLAAFPFVEYIQPVAKNVLLNDKARQMSGAYVLNAAVANGGNALNGAGVVVGVGDNADPSLHPDLTDRIINRTPGIVERHGSHVTGTIAGGGILLSEKHGLAPMATIISQYFTGIWTNAAAYIKDFGMVITNNSYGASEGDCDFYGVYDLYSQLLDMQAKDFPQLLHVFSSGNSGDNTCSPLPQGYGSILGAYQSAKNVITVGRTDFNQVASGSSSGGPVNDGRLKPEITALGIIESTNETNDYVTEYGTSQSAPVVSGGLALLYEDYRKLHSGSNPPGALIKSILLNGTRDIGNPGPDYRSGYGFIDLPNSIRILNNQLYFGGNMAHGSQKDSVITVAPGTAKLKVLLYWHDPAASPLAVKTLVNDLDLEVLLPDGTTVVYPKILNPANPAATATEGADHTNNSEQVIIDAPLPGNYTVRIKGTDVLASPSQPFYVAFDYLPQSLAIRSPLQGDNWSVTEKDFFGGATALMISWYDEGTGSGTYKIEYSENGGSYVTIVDNLDDTERYLGWNPPAGTATNAARIRITKSNGAFTSTSGAFTIIDRPDFTVANTCEGYLSVNWTGVTGADDYEVVMKKGPQMEPVAVVLPPVLSYTITGLNKDSTYYVAVRARKGGVAGKWKKAAAVVPKAGACAGTISDGDLKLDSVVSPIYGRQFTSSNLSSNETVKVRIKNLDDAVAATGTFNVKYSLDGGPFVSQPGTAAVPAQGNYVHSFTGIDLSALGTHVLTAVVENTALTDQVPANDSFTLIIKNLANSPISLVDKFVEDYESAPAFYLQQNTYGLPGLDRWDYFNTDQYARARSFVNSGIAYSGNKAITLDVSKATPYATNPANNLRGTFNIGNYNTTDEIRLDFNFKFHGPAQVPNPENRVWVRGSDSNNWIEVYDLDANLPNDAGVWKRSSSIELNDILAGASPAQQFSSSTEVRFGQYSLYSMADNTLLGGLSFDDVRLYIAVNDLQMRSIDTPAIFSCGLNNAVPIKITVRNSSSQPLFNTPVSYSVNGLVIANEIIATGIPANSSFVYQFVKQANLAATGSYTIEATVNYPGDNLPENNSTAATIYNQPVISSFPYLENFEQDNGHFFVTGTNASWQYGKPASIKIDSAASGTKAWKTTLAGNYYDKENSQLNSPCFDISKLANPMLSFSMAYDLEDCRQYGVMCDAAWVEYSTDGISWQKLGTANLGTNWYDAVDTNVWLERKHTHWHVASIPLPKGAGNLRLRFVLKSDEATNYEGVAIDDIHVYDLVSPIYTTTGTSSSIVQNVAGNIPVQFTTGGKLVATILPNNNDLGSTEVKAYIFNGFVRNNGQQYYGNRNITIKPANTINGNATVRFYFSDQEADSLRLAASCNTCTNPKDYTHIGVTQYTDDNKANEDGDLANNVNGISHYINGSQLKMVPYDAGYYAEFSVGGFSEFWLNDGKGISLPLPSRWLSFDAVKLNTGDVKLTWSAANEVAINRYEIQVANSRQAVTANLFETIGTTPGRNIAVADYIYLDQRSAKSGDYYYRIKQVDSDGKFYYSPVILVRFDLRDFEVRLYPNPVKSNLIVSIATPVTKSILLVVYNMAGQQLYTQSWTAAPGSMQQVIPTSRLGLSSGVYTVAVTDGNNWWRTKLVKE